MYSSNVDGIEVYHTQRNKSKADKGMQYESIHLFSRERKKNHDLDING